MSTPIQENEVLALAAFLDAGDHLSQSEFFGDDDHCSYGSDGGTFGPSETFQAVLGSFRRTWMKTEEANFDAVANIVEKHSLSPERRGIAQEQRMLFNQQKELKAEGTSLTYAQLVNLWLYTQYAHCQTKRNGKRFIRQDFDKLSKLHGREYLEFHVRWAIKLLGAHVLVLYHYAALQEYDDWITVRGITPPFEATNAFASGAKEVSDNGQKIHRVAHPLLGKEPPAHKLARLLERDPFRPLKGILQRLFNLEYSEESETAYTNAVDSILANPTITDLVRAVGYIEVSETPALQYCSRHFFSDTGFSQKGTVEMFFSRQIVFHDDAKEILERLYAEIRSLLLSQKAKSTFLDVQKRLEKEIAERNTRRAKISRA